MTRLHATEAQVEGAVRDYLHLVGWRTLKTDASLVVRGSGRGGVIDVGTADLLAYRANARRPGLLEAFLLETKTQSGRLRITQERRALELRATGIDTHVARSVEDAVALLARLDRSGLW